MKFVDAVIGNSSSGIVEAPALGVPTVNIGSRQKGRLRAPSIIDCAGNKNDIADAISRALEPGFRAALKTMTPPYGAGGASEKIKAHLKTADLATIADKSFHDIALERVPT
jgi:UDP-N-acetylglucosamine 2-epimerase